MTLGDHLEDLRDTILRSLYVLIGTSVLAGFFSPNIHRFLTVPFFALQVQAPDPSNAAATILLKPTLILGNVYGPLEVMIQLSMICGFAISFPIILLFFWSFITPAVSKKTARIGTAIVASSTLLFWTGLLFCWYYVFPFSLAFMFTDFLPLGTSPIITIEKYYSFLFALHIACGILFQFPMLVIILGAIGIVTLEWHRNYWKYVVVVILVLAAVMTPPDWISQLLFFVPVTLLYAISVLFLYGIEWRRNKG